MNHRFGWFLTSESSLFTALGLSWDKGKAIVLILAAIGLAICVSMFLAPRLPIAVQKKLEHLWFEWCSARNIDPKAHPPVAGMSDVEHGAIERILLPRRFLPWLFAATWVVLGAVGIRGLSTMPREKRSRRGLQTFIRFLTVFDGRSELALVRAALASHLHRP